MTCSRCSVVVFVWVRVGRSVWVALKTWVRERVSRPERDPESVSSDDDTVGDRRRVVKVQERVEDAVAVVLVVKLSVLD